MYCIDAVTAVLCCTVLMSAAVSDARSREVSDIHWAAIVAIASVGVLAGTRDIPAFASAVLLFAAFSVGRRRVSVPQGMCAVVFWAAAFLMGAPLMELAQPAVIGLLYLGYLSGLIKGGADAKALMAVEIAFPANPGHNAVLPNPVMGVLLCALVFAVVCWGPWLVWKAVRTGCVSELPCLRMPISSAERSFVWPAEAVSEGRIVRSRDVRWEDIPAVYGELRRMGAENVLVEPMIPFIVPIAAAFIAVVMPGALFGMRS